MLFANREGLATQFKLRWKSKQYLIVENVLLCSDKNVIKTASYERRAKCLTELCLPAACVCDHYGNLTDV